MIVVFVVVMVSSFFVGVVAVIADTLVAVITLLGRTSPPALPVALLVAGPEDQQQRCMDHELWRWLIERRLTDAKSLLGV